MLYSVLRTRRAPVIGTLLEIAGAWDGHTIAKLNIDQRLDKLWWCYKNAVNITLPPTQLYRIIGEIYLDSYSLEWVPYKRR